MADNLLIACVHLIFVIWALIVELCESIPVDDEYFSFIYRFRAYILVLIHQNRE